MVRKLPAQGIVKTLDLECQMLENDIENNRLPVPADAFSIFFFREFVNAVKLGRTVNCGRPMPADHIEFFRETILRLVLAGELPQAAIDQFDRVFLGDEF